LISLPPDGSIQLREFIFFSELVEDLLKSSVLSLKLINSEFVSIRLHLLNEAKQVTDALITWFIDLDCHLVASKVCESSLAKLFFKMGINCRDLIQNYDPLEKCLQVDWLLVLNLIVLELEHTMSIKLIVELWSNHFSAFTIEVFILFCIRHFTLEPLSDSFLYFFQRHVVSIWIPQLTLFINNLSLVSIKCSNSIRISRGDVGVGKDINSII